MYHMEAAAGDDGGQGYESSSDEDLDDDKILSTTYEAYAGQIGDNGEGVDKSKQFLRDAWLSGASGCLVCLGKVKRIDAIWSCSECHCVLHLVCIQKWAQQCTMLQDLHSDESIPSSKAMWQCPKCRADYRMAACPRQYLCFCGKEKDPPAHPWLAPHTCGQTCEKPLRPQCGHKCLLLCHPGPCPPCPKMVRSPCYCGQSTPQTRRCSTRQWSCGQICQRPLTCGQHMCQTPCHSGDCPPCDKTSQQRCMCGKGEQVRPCASPEWSCDKICGKVLSCGSHTCEKECHQQGQCGDCPRSGQRTCPCGKTKFDLPCTEDIPNCGDTCEKLLSCGIHQCSQRCHTGECEKCRQMCTKKCRCGLRERSVLCHKEYLCDSKCSQMRDCTRHQCKRKCCDGSCPPCEQSCGRQLTCKNHKCQSRCHSGMCYPCPEIVEIKCFCGNTTITVPCGREKVTRPPRCSKKCSTAPDCHHPTRDHHRCHFGRCPPCRQMCAQPLLHCSHVCPKVCHSAVLVKQVENKPAPAGPWEAKPKAMLTMVNFPCPPCEVPIPTECLGKHEVTDLPCSSVAPFSCGRLCGRLLDCGNHTCGLACHIVTGAQKDHESGRECAQCEEGCSKPRPKGCTHTCLEPCHPDLCPTCQQGVRVRCHCHMMVLHKECGLWTAANKQEKKKLMSCDGPCPKQLTCGHQCSKICHDGECSKPQRLHL
ncbi:NF-X1-type zinc finger protein NFXL1-like [Amphiura filiformis]|uniref:NF-X1-type zinc finger protein NFXL1-like n=1 Tax=Amphiura filiformis TaxID=82378 RepID=UPI003B220D68